MSDRLPTGIAFPISVSDLQSKLTQAPQLTEINFNCLYVKSMSERKRAQTKFGRSHKSLVTGKSIEIIIADYELSPVHLTTPNAWLREGSRMNKYTEGRWKIQIRAIPEDELVKVRECLNKDGYSKLLAWLLESNGHAGSICHRTLTIIFDGHQLVYRQLERR